MIIIEGPDGSGKSTLSKMLNRTFRIPRMHSLRELPIDENQAAERFAWNRSLLGIEIIMDRCYPISEWVHGNILRSESLITANQIEQFIHDMNHTARVVYLFCDQFFDHIITEETADREMKAEENWDKIIGAYRELYKRIRCERWRIQNMDDYPEVLWMIRRIYER